VRSDGWTFSSNKKTSNEKNKVEASTGRKPVLSIKGLVMERRCYG
jgi:hypothetical protein